MLHDDLNRPWELLPKTKSDLNQMPCYDIADSMNLKGVVELHYVHAECFLRRPATANHALQRTAPVRHVGCSATFARAAVVPALRSR